jgi:ion channel-forming bestrophin family protein
MHAGRHYTVGQILIWTRREIFIFLGISSIPSLLYQLGIEATLPWSPIAVLGIAVAFLVGFKSNAAYGRLWEARQIWGAIVNASRTWGFSVRDLLPETPNGGDHRRLILRHVAWLTALRFQLREPRAWETQHRRYNVEYRVRTFAVPEWTSSLEDELSRLLEPEEKALVLSKKNRATAVLALQSAELRRAREAGRLAEYSHVELVRGLSLLIGEQGKSERIKNFPYPRQYATLTMAFVWLFVLLLPFGMAGELKRMGPAWIWLSIPLAAVVAWVFHTMDKIGEASENPFEGGPNDVPISAMSRSIEIDLLDLLGETELPKPMAPSGNILM